MVAKDEAGPYVGGRTRAWLKVKQANWIEGEHRWRRRMPAAAALLARYSSCPVADEEAAERLAAELERLPERHAGPVLLLIALPPGS